MEDIRDKLFAPLKGKKFLAEIRAEETGIIAGIENLERKVSEIDIDMEMKVGEGKKVQSQDLVCLVEGNPKELAIAEEIAVGSLAKPSGIATAARRAVEEAGDELRIVSGAWKKQPVEIKEIVKNAVRTGGAHVKMAHEPFLYLDKNYVRMFGGVERMLEKASEFPDRNVVIQIRGETGNVGEEAVLAAKNDVDVLMIDTGVIADIEKVSDALEKEGLRREVEVAFAGGVALEDINAIKRAGADAVDIGREIVDAPMLDFTLDVISDSG